MYINATILVQAFHFFIAYLVLRFFFYKPIVALIQQRDQEKNTLIQSIADTKLVIQSKEDTINQYWQKQQQELLKSLPLVRKPRIISIPQIQAVEKISDTELKHLVKQISELIVQKADHVS